MSSSNPPVDEMRRLQTLRRYRVLDTPPERAFDELTALAAYICAAPISLISLIDEHRQWFKSSFGFGAREVPRDLSFCVHVLELAELLIVPDATQDAKFALNPQVTGEPGIRFYAGAPLITPEGEVLGALCVIDRVPRTLSEEQKQALRVLSRQVVMQLELRRQATGLAASEARYRALFDYAPDGILIADACSTYLDANASMCRMLGYKREELIGRHAEDIVIPGEIPLIETALNQIKVRTDYHREWHLRRSDHSIFPAEVMATQMPDGNIMGMVRDITERKRHEREIARLSRLYAALSQVNQAIVRMPTREELFQEVCRVLVELGGFDMVWIGWADAKTRRLQPVAECGDENGYLQSIEIYTDDRPEGRGPSGTACREGRPYICNDMVDDPGTVPWRAEVKRRDWRASAAFPIRLQNEVCGTLTVYADEAGFFQDKEIELLVKAADDISFALENRASEAARRHAEAIAQGEKLFSDTMIESMPGILYFYDDQGRFLRWNRNFETVSGYSGEEIAQMHPLDFFASADQRPLQERIEEVFAVGESAIEAPFLSKDGQTTPYFFTGRRVIFEGKACLVGVGIDISERKRAETLLRSSEANLIRAQRIAHMGSWELNISSRHLTWSEEISRIFGIAPIESGATYEAFIAAVHPEDRVLLQKAQDRALRGQAELSIEHRIVRPDGTVRWVYEVGELERDEAGLPVKLRGTALDITERKQAEQLLVEAKGNLEMKVIERTAELQTALVRAEAADRLKSAFLATMSHELRTPLNSIIGFTGTVLLGLPGPLNAEQSKQLGMVRSSARHLLELINDVLDLSKIEAGQLKVRTEHFDLRTSLEHAAASVKVLADKKGLALTAEIAAGVGGITSDRRRVEQIVLNLLNNAIKFTDRGGVTLTAGLVADFRPSLGAPPLPAVRISVVDTGIGIKTEDYASLFQPFRQMDSGLSRQHEGTGLGLAICRRLTILLGGAISVESEWSRGSAFTVTLPLQMPSES